MDTAKDRLLKIIDEIPEREMDKTLDFAEYLKAKRDKSLSEDLTKLVRVAWTFGIMTLMMRFGTMYKQGEIVLIPVPFRDLKTKVPGLLTSGCFSF